MTSQTSECDIVVVGAGTVGLTAALACARAGFATCLVGPSAPRPDGRTVALLGDSVAFLRGLGVWPRLEPDMAPLRVMQIIDDTGSLFRPPPARFAAAEIGAEAFGFNIETAALLAGLSSLAAAREDLSWLRQGVAGIARGARPLLTLEDGATVAADLVIGADGRRSIVRDAAGIAATTWSYPQAALTTILAHDGDHADTSTEFHTSFGPFTLVPMPGRRSSLVWVTHPRHAARLVALDDRALGQAIERQAQSILGAMRIDGPRGVVPIGGLSVDRLHAPGFALVGEAAHVLPPIGAQGLNLGLRDVERLRDIVVKARAAGEPIGGQEVLQRYQAERMGDIRLRGGGVDALNRSLTADILPSHLLRGMGLLAAGQIPALRRMLMREGLGARDEPAPRQSLRR